MRTCLAAALLAMLLTAAPADAAKRKVPFGFFGTVFGISQANRISDRELDAQVTLMARSGVESLRTSFTWAALEPERGRYDFSSSDRLVAAAARHRIEVLPIVMSTPRWASTGGERNDFSLWAPRDPALYADFMRVLVRRYGPKGTFWRTSGTPKVPIRVWQVWNEPAADFFWASQPWPRTYVNLLKPAYRAIKRADRRATVMLAAVAGLSWGDPWTQVQAMYRAGAKGNFDVISAHFYSAPRSVSSTVDQALEMTRRIHSEVRRARDRKRRIFFTEVTWTAALGLIPRDEERGFETTARGQSQRLRAVFSRLARDRRKLRVGSLHWYNWASEYVPTLVQGSGAITFQYAGLNRFASNVFTRLPVLSTYASTAARFEGCRKSANARRCR
jgi:Beta-galactosidase/Glycosyl hydrolase family 53